MFKSNVKKLVAIVAVAVFVIGTGLGTWALIVKGQAPSLPTNGDGSIPIPVDMIQEFEKVTGEPINKLSDEIKAIRERQKTLEPFYIQLRMNTLQKAQVPANQYQNWMLDTEKKALIKIDPKTGQPVK